MPQHLDLRPTPERGQTAVPTRNMFADPPRSATTPQMVDGVTGGGAVPDEERVGSRGDHRIDKRGDARFDILVALDM